MKLKKLILYVCLITLLPTISLADEYSADEFIEENEIKAVSASNVAEIPSINARHAIVLDRASKTILYGKDENSLCKMASTTKIMTAIIVLENCQDLNSEVSVSKKAARNGRIQTGTLIKY